MWIVMRSGEPFARSGVWETWRTQRGGRPDLRVHNHGGNRSAEAGTPQYAGDSI